MKFFFIYLVIFFLSLNVQSKTYGIVTGLEIPRYVSLKFNESNMRKGPSKNYPIKYKYLIINTPVEIIEENGHWRKIKDIENNEGWMNKGLLKGNRYGLINIPYNQGAQIYDYPHGNVIGRIKKMNIVKINKCFGDWCFIQINKVIKGWVLKYNLWGIYNDESFNMPFYQPLIEKYWFMLSKLRN
jgi:SH3-like domain-containing protein